MDESAAIEIKNLTKRYVLGKSDQYLTLRDHLMDWPRTFFQKKAPPKSFLALSDISLTIKRGEVVGVVGKNGAGKSTLLKIISKITEPTSGTFLLRGKVVSLLEVGTGFNFELTGRENIYLNGAILGMSRTEIRSKFNTIVEFAGIADFLDTPVKKYSTGMYVRLAFAIAAHLESDILLVDEVLAVGDAEFQKKCLGKMDALAHSGRTVIFVSHNMGTILGLCNRAILLSNGELLAVGKPAKIIEHYLSLGKNLHPHSLATITNRRGVGEVKLVKVLFTDQADSPLTSPIVGEPLQIKLSYQSSLSRLTHPRFGISITNGFGQIITMLHSFQSENKFNSLPGSGTVTCTLPKLPLMPGSYSLTLGISCSGTLQDELELPGSLTIENGTFYPSGMLGLDPKLQGIFVEQIWSTS